MDCQDSLCVARVALVPYSLRLVTGSVPVEVLKKKSPTCDLGHRPERKGLAFSVHWHEILLQNRHDDAPLSLGSRVFAAVCGDAVPESGEVFDVLRSGMPDDDGNEEGPRSISDRVRHFDEMRLPGISGRACFGCDCASDARIERCDACGQPACRFCVHRGDSRGRKLYPARPGVVQTLPVRPLHLPNLIFASGRILQHA